jgi:hypothetical protein
VAFIFTGQSGKIKDNKKKKKLEWEWKYDRNRPEETTGQLVNTST